MRSRRRTARWHPLCSPCALRLSSHPVHRVWISTRSPRQVAAELARYDARVAAEVQAEAEAAALPVRALLYLR